MALFGIDNQNLITGQYIPFADVGSMPGGIPASPADIALDSSGQSDFALMLEKEADQQAAAQPAADTPVLSGGKAVIDRSSKLFETCQELETFLLKTLISSMRDTIQKSDLVDSGYAGQVYEDMLYDEYAKSFSENAGFGFAEQAYLELTGQRGKTIARY
ncbi:MAG: rod-binding protein [Treponema sp.]|nr:rod-binding protein [Treponema sp.]